MACYPHGRAVGCLWICAITVYWDSSDLYRSTLWTTVLECFGVILNRATDGSGSIVSEIVSMNWHLAGMFRWTKSNRTKLLMCLALWHPITISRSFGNDLNILYTFITCGEKGNSQATGISKLQKKEIIYKKITTQTS